MTHDAATQDPLTEPRHIYLYLLLSQVAYTVVYPVVSAATGLTIILEVFLLVALVGGVLPSIARDELPAAQSRRRLMVSAGLAVLFLLTRWGGLLFDAAALVPISALFGVAFFAYVAAVLIRHIFLASQNVDADLIYGAVSVYLLIGVSFGFAYVCLVTLVPDAFAGVDAALIPARELVRELNYFSFVTLTTLGYGDITPQSHQAGVLAYLEAIIGQIYLTVLVARLVGMHIAQRQIPQQAMPRP